MNKIDLRKILVPWLASFAFAALILFFYFKAPLMPILLAGVATGVITFVRYFLSKKQ